MITKTPSLPAIGSYLVASWGYDQTNIDFYKIVGYTPSKKSVKLQHVQNKITNFTGPMSEKVVPSETPRGEVITKRIRVNEKNPEYTCASICSVRTAFVWDGKPEEASHYH